MRRCTEYVRPPTVSVELGGLGSSSATNPGVSAGEYCTSPKSCSHCRNAKVYVICCPAYTVLRSTVCFTCADWPDGAPPKVPLPKGNPDDAPPPPPPVPGVTMMLNDCVW